MRLFFFKSQSHNFQLILVWRFPVDISQSSIGGRTTLSNACTLIALKIAELVHIHDIKMPIPYPTRNDRVAAGAERTQRKHYIRSSADETVVDNNGFETVRLFRLSLIIGL